VGVGRHTDYIATCFGCDGTNNRGWYCDPRIDALNARARSLQESDPHRAAALWSTIDRELVDHSACVPTVNEHELDFLSARVTNYQALPSWGMLADQLWIRR
jgi:ABC-type transport system substrate-binding protein